jgi:hypothetical protein
MVRWLVVGLAVCAPAAAAQNVVAPARLKPPDTATVTIIHGYRLPTAEDTAAIRRVAPGPGERVAPQRVEPLRIVADTAWITVWKHVDIPSVNGSTAGSGVIPRVVRLERRKGSWMVVRKEASR